MQDWPQKPEENETKLEDLMGGAIRLLIDKELAIHPEIKEYDELVNKFGISLFKKNLADRARIFAEEWDERIQKIKEEGEEVSREEITTMKDLYNTAFAESEKADRVLAESYSRMREIMKDPKIAPVLQSLQEKLIECIQKYNPPKPSGLN